MLIDINKHKYTKKDGGVNDFGVDKLRSLKNGHNQILRKKIDSKFSL